MPEEYARGDSMMTGIFSGRALMPWEMGRADWTQGVGKIRQAECSTRSMQRSFFECAYHPGRSFSRGHSICDSPEQEMAWEKSCSLQN